MRKLQEKAPTFDDVWRTIQELAQMGKETERLMNERTAETDRQIKSVNKKFPSVIPAKAGIQRILDTCLRGNECAREGATLAR